MKCFLCNHKSLVCSKENICLVCSFRNQKFIHLLESNGLSLDDFDKHDKLLISKPSNRPKHYKKNYRPKQMKDFMEHPVKDIIKIEYDEKLKHIVYL